MHPILFELPGGFPIRSFGVMVALGFLLGSWIYTRLVAARSSDPARDVERYGSATMWALVGVVLGARLMYVAVEIAKGSPVGQQYIEEPWTVLFIWEGGLVMYGGLFGGLLVGGWAVRKRGLPLFHAMDMGLTGGFFGLAVGRIGCLLVGDDYGRIVPEAFRSLPFPIVLRVPDPLPPHSLFAPESAGQLVWATQVWMAVNATLIGCLGLWLLKRRKYPGQVTLVMCLVYALTRAVIEAFRGDAVRGTWFGGAVSTSQIIGAGVALLCASLLVRYRDRRVQVVAQ